MKVIIVGAGLAGLTCARQLQKSGAEVVVYEKSDGIGGRVRSDLVEGFTLDRGFQVFFTAYPAAKRQLDYAALDLRAFEPGALIAQGDRRHLLSDPSRDPDALIPSLLTGIVTTQDKYRTWRLSGEVGAKPISALLDGPDETTERFLKRRGFSPLFMENFIRPFFGGIFLDRSLQTSARVFQFCWKMLSEGETTLPARGMGAIAAQLAEGLDIRLESPVENLASLDADAVIVATAAPEAARLTGVKTPEGSVSTTTLYFVGKVPLWAGRKILLNANCDPVVNQAALLTNTAPEYAPRGEHLLSASVIGIPDQDDDALFAAALTDLRRMFTGDITAQSALATYRPLRAYRIPYAQFAQPKNFWQQLPTNQTTLPKTYFAGEFTAASSINGAMRSGEKAAEEILAGARPGHGES
ncbi:MAG: NAD(P)/FAD-dependent oxidoreductase [Armatimonadetes bacterium]|nr:NAD(P)/FAD-dependent oxidoreductase [Armatimonadota bacterium]